MGIRHWLRKKRVEQDEEGEEDRAPSFSILSAIFGREPPTLHALGEYDQNTYPGELQDLLRRREDVASELREMDLTSRQARVDAIPRLQQMLRTYPHPLAYETLIHAYVDAGRWDEARGAAFAARERRTQVSRSPYSEIRAEIDRLKEWTPEEVDLVRREREGSAAPATSPSQAPTRVEQAAREQLMEPVRQEEEVEATIQAVSERPVEAPEPDAAAETMIAADASESADAADLADVSDAEDAEEGDDSGDPDDDGDLDDSGELDDSGAEVSDDAQPSAGASASGGNRPAPRRSGKKKSRGKRR